MSAYGDLVVQVCSTSGTGATLTLAAAVPPYLTAQKAGFRDGDQVSWSLVDGLSNCESGYGQLSNGQTQLTRNTLFSSNNNAPISLSGGATLRITPMQRDMIALNQFVFSCFGVR